MTCQSSASLGWTGAFSDVLFPCRQSQRKIQSGGPLWLSPETEPSCPLSHLGTPAKKREEQIENKQCRWCVFIVDTSFPGEQCVVCQGKVPITHLSNFFSLVFFLPLWLAFTHKEQTRNSQCHKVFLWNVCNHSVITAQRLQCCGSQCTVRPGGHPDVQSVNRHLRDAMVWETGRCSTSRLQLVSD